VVGSALALVIDPIRRIVA